MSETVMVTGAAGFIGSHLVETLLERGDTVIASDMADPQRSHNLDLVRENPRFHYTRLDIRDREGLAAWYEPEASTVYHLASVVGVQHYLEDPLSLVDVVVGGTRNVLALAADNHTRFVFASTSEVFGRNPAVPWKEDADRVLGATSVDRWSYSSSKGVCEHMIYGMARVKELEFTIVRPFNVYGPRQNPIYVVSQSVYSALRNEPPLVFDGGAQTRCFTYVADLVNGMILAATSPAGIGEVFNLGSDVERTIADAVRISSEAAGQSESAAVAFDTSVEYGKTYEDIIRRIPNVEKAKSVLGWQADTTLEEGIRKTVEWARQNPWYLADRT
jgi:UDP-glucose 4-epimerase